MKGGVLWLFDNTFGVCANAVIRVISLPQTRIASSKEALFLNIFLPYFTYFCVGRTLFTFLELRFHF